MGWVTPSTFYIVTFSLRAKWVIAQYGVPIALILGVVGLLAVAGAVSAYTSPETRQVTETVDEQRFGTAISTSAIVVEDSTLYDQGTTLEDQPAYFYNATPDVRIQVLTSVPDDREVAVSQRLVIRHVAERDGEPFWEATRVLATSDDTVSDGEAALNATVAMRDVQATVADVRQEIGGVGRVRTELRLHVDYRTGPVDDTLTTAPTVELTDRAYWLDGGRTANQTHSDTATREVTVPTSARETFLLGGFGAGVLLLAIGIFGLQRREFDLDRIEMEITRSRYDEWISRGEIPTKAEKQYITIDTLEDLVDIAIDSNKRVIYDTTYETYGVVDGDLVYYYTEGDDEFGEWLDI